MRDSLSMIPLSALRKSKQNVRKTNSTGDLEELAASIAGLGVLQNLTVRPVEKTGKKKDRSFEVVAGGRRLAALKLLAKKKKIDGSYPVPCRILSGDDGTEVSLAENVVRTSLHPADQFEAFSKLQAEGHGIEEIAARFGISPHTVQQRLRLAAVSPKLMAAYRAGEMSLDQLVTFTVTDDHESQERVWFDTPSYDRHPSSLRRMLTQSLVEGSDRRARFVGVGAYEEAGGTVVRDLFREEDDGYFADSELLDRLVHKKLESEAETVRTKGWSWVEIIPELDYAYLSTFRRIPPEEVPLTKKEQARFDKLAKRHDKLIADLEDDPAEEVVEELDRIAAELKELSAKREQWSEEDKARSGVVISLDYQGNLVVTHGLTKEASESTKNRKGKVRVANGADQSEPRPLASLSDRLVEDLSAHRTAALREAIAGAPEVALTGLLHSLVQSVFFGPATGETCIDIRPAIVDLRSSADGIGESRAVAAMAARHLAWSEQFPDRAGLWDWIAGQSGEIRLELLAHCVAVTINAVRRRCDGPATARFDQADRLAIAANLDMAEWWEPTREAYLNRVSKAFISNAVAEGVSPQAGDTIQGLKKDAMAARAEELLRGSRWLPEMLRSPESTVSETT